MDVVIDKLITELRTLAASPYFQSVLPDAEMVYWDDPLIVTVNEYPYMYVSPVSDEPDLETMGRAGYDVRDLAIEIGIVINAGDYFVGDDEKPGSKRLVQAAGQVRNLLRRLSKKSLDNLAGVRNVVVSSINYVPDSRNEVFVRLAVISLSVERQYQHEE